MCVPEDGESDPCRLCAIERCCDRRQPFGLEAHAPCWFWPGGGECVADSLPTMQACYAEKLAVGSTGASIDIIGECMCELWYVTPDEDRECGGPRDPSPGNDSPPANFIACLVWPEESDGDGGASDAGPSGDTLCGAECFPPWR
jgi:hypothetical protein